MKNFVLIALTVFVGLGVQVAKAETKAKKSETAMTDFKVNPYGKIFTDREGDITIEMALREDKNSEGLNDVLLKITGAAAHSEGIDGKTMYYGAVAAGTGSNFTYMKDGQEKVRMITRDSWGSWKNFEVYVDGKTFHVYGDEKKSKEVRPLHLLTAYKKGE